MVHQFQCLIGSLIEFGIYARPDMTKPSMGTPCEGFDCQWLRGQDLNL